MTVITESYRLGWLLELYILATSKVIPGQVLIWLLVFDAIETVFQLYLGGDVMYDMREERKPEPTL